MMTSVSEVANEERTARMVLSMLIEPNDPVTGRILSRLGAVETLWLAERDGAVVGLSLWTRRSGKRVRLRSSGESLATCLRGVQSGTRTTQLYRAFAPLLGPHGPGGIYTSDRRTNIGRWSYRDSA